MQMNPEKFLKLLMCFCLLVAQYGCIQVADDNNNVNDPAVGDGSGDDTPEDGFHIDTMLMESYFSDVLRGQNADYTQSLEIDPENITDFQKFVWNIWTKTNNSFIEDKLPIPTSLYLMDNVAVNVSGAWTLSNGEDLVFIYGYKGAQPTDGFPLFLFLHGSGDNTEEFDLNLRAAKSFSDSPALYFIPRSPKSFNWCRWYQPSRQYAWERLLRQAFLSGQVNPNQIYFIGISEGAYGSQRLASFYADYLAGAGPVAGGEQLFWAPPENCASIAFCLQTGEYDTMYGRTLLNRRADEQWNHLQALHPGYYNHKIDLQPDFGHVCDYKVTTPYLKEFSRNPYPKYVYWENFPLGNINGEGSAFRNGFYNLYVKERSTDDSDDFVRSCYEMVIDENNISLSVNVVTVIPDDPVFCEDIEDWEMSIGESKSFQQASCGRIVIFLNDELVDLSKPVIVTVNGVEKFNGMVTPNLKDMVVSCAQYFDPARIFPASIEVSVE